MEAYHSGYERSSSSNLEWSRELGDTEYPMVMAIGGDEASKPGKRRENLLIHAIAQFTTATISVEVLSTQFKSAWTALRLLHSPDIATEFEGKNKIYRSPANTTELQTWLDRTFEVIDIGDEQGSESVRQATARKIKERQEQIELLPTCTVILHQKGSQVVEGAVILFISHWRIEAGGALALIDRLVDMTVQLVRDGEDCVYAKALKKFTYDGSEVDKLTPTVEDALMPKDTQSSSASKERVARRLKEMSDKMSNNLHVAITSDGANADKSPYKINERVYSASFTSTLAKKCKNANVSVTSAIHAAYLCALYTEATDKQEKVTYASIMPAQVRTRINDGKSLLRQQGCWNAALMLFLALDLVPIQDGVLDLISVARALKQQYQIATGRDWLYEDARQTSVQLIEFFTQTIGNAPTNKTARVLDKEVINKQHGDEKANLQINKISAWADSIASGMVMRVWTFDGRLNIQLSSNQAWHSEEQIERLLDRTEEELKKAFDFVVRAEEQIIDAY
ncbi:uncharacterized protein FA14DRAFT_190581 [Meira miltonrushii]|uniref:CoA-dependent acyltransferase n=1 Tax=Meira miltonrushii TaxID=1280837 RepID=A0A316V7L0_9BASI|nr:uncharacterized protein FA14DRAFT_190581 [Meira miltonrushii]PWN33432.1 hypothetical protein FA14DRAFT_190581 [Meira miltonrushii]